MKYVFLFASLVIIGCSQSPKDCSRFREGTFKYSDPVYGNITVVRNDSIQIESDIVNNTKIIGAVEWMSDCKYTLTYKEAINFSQNDLVGRQIEVEITETNNNSYRCIISDGLSDSDIWIVKVD